MGTRSFVCALTVAGLTALAPMSAVAQESSVTFYETLSPYGDWVVVENYGRVWRPNRTVVGVDFVPYASGGHWVHSNVGWVFEPSWSWGWLPFHYGRWYQDDFNGWVWVPDNVWAPAWVDWRVGGGYIGWAPSPPRYHLHARPNYYYVENRHFVEPQIWQHRAVAVNADEVYQATRPIAPPAGRAWAPGPQVSEVRSAVQVPVPERRIEQPMKPMPIFPSNLPPAPAPAARGERAVPEPASPKLQPVDRGPMQPMPQPMTNQRAPEPMNNNRGPMPAAPQPMTNQRAPEPMNNNRGPMPAAPQPMTNQNNSVPPAPSRGPMTIERVPSSQPQQREPMRGAPPPSMQRTPSEYPSPQRSPMRQGPMAPMPVPQAQPAPAPVQQKRAQPLPAQPVPGAMPSGGPRHAPAPPPH